MKPTTESRRRSNTGGPAAQLYASPVLPTELPPAETVYKRILAVDFDLTTVSPCHRFHRRPQALGRWPSICMIKKFRSLHIKAAEKVFTACNKARLRFSAAPY